MAAPAHRAGAGTSSRRREGRLVHWRVSQPGHQAAGSFGSSARGGCGRLKVPSSEAAGPARNPRGGNAKAAARRDVSGARRFQAGRAARARAPWRAQSESDAVCGGDDQGEAPVSERENRSSHVADEPSADWLRHEGPTRATPPAPRGDRMEHQTESERPEGLIRVTHQPRRDDAG